MDGMDGVVSGELTAGAGERDDGNRAASVDLVDG